METLQDLPETYREAACLWEAFRRLGFSATDIWALTAMTPIDGALRLALFIVLKAQDKEFSIAAGPVESEAEATQMWLLTCSIVQNGEERALGRAWQASKAASAFLAIADALKRKGFVFPALLS